MVDKKRLAAEEFEIRQKLHDLNKKENDITKSYGRVLQTQLDTQKQITDVLKARVNLAGKMDDILEEDISNKQKALKLNEQIKIIEKEQGKLAKQYIGKNKHIADLKIAELNTDKKMLEVHRS